MSRTFAEDVLVRLRGVLDPVYDGHVPLGPDGRPVAQRYAVLYATPPLRSWEDVGATPTEVVCRWQVTAGGSSARQVLDVATTCEAGLTGARLDVDGWVSDLVEHVSASPITRDDDYPGDDPVFFAVSTFRAHMSAERQQT